MEKSPLLSAHQNDRKADNHILYKRFDEAVTCHKNASELLLHAMQLTSVTRCLEALQLQYEYHKRQEDIVQVKKFQFEIQKKIIEYRNKKMTMQKKTTQKESKDQDLHWAIFRTMEETDSLLGKLMPKESIPEPNLSTSPGHKQPIDDRTVIEELHTLNTQLRAFISQLLAQLEASEKQVESLKARLRAYEDDTRLLPELAPLEMPQYDFPSPPPSIFPPDIGHNDS